MKDLAERIKENRKALQALIDLGDKRTAEQDKELRELTAAAAKLTAEREARAALALSDPPADPEPRMGDHTKKADPDYDDDMADKKAADKTEGRAADKGGEPEKRDLNPTGKTGTPSGAPLPTGGPTHSMWTRTSEVREFIKIAQRSSAAKFIENIAKGRGDALKGVERELRAALNAEVNTLPWAALVDRTFLDQAAEGRALEEIDPLIDLETLAPEIRLSGDAATSIATDMQGRFQNAIVQRVFTRGSTAWMGIMVQPVPTGDIMWPVLTGGVSPAFTAAGTAKAAEAATFSVKILSPQDLTAAYNFYLKDLARVKGYESALRADLRMAMNDQLDQSILNGGASPNLDGGLIHALTERRAGATGSAADWSRWAAMYAGAVDGLYAYGGSDLRLLLAPDAYANAEALVQSNTAVTAMEQITRRTGGARVSANMPAISGNDTTILIAKMAQGATNAVAAVWNIGINLIRDNISEADKRQARITAVGFYDCDLLRPAGFDEVVMQLTS